MRPGDLLVMSWSKSVPKALVEVTGTATVNGKLVAEAEFGAMIVDPDR